jgi:iron complex transport system substrate-binding protein
MNLRLPERIVCLSGETVEVLYLLGEERRLVGISSFASRPAGARTEKAVISSFATTNLDKIVQLKPDLILGFSDVQTDLFRDLVRSGFEVHLFNQRTIQGILNMILLLGAMVGAQTLSKRLTTQLVTHLTKVRKKSLDLKSHPVIYFEEWNEPLICGIGWVSELIEIAGGKDCFAEMALRPGAGERIIQDPSEVIKKKPDIIIGSWCGRPFHPEKVMEREGWNSIPAVKENFIFEIPSSDILQPGPSALTDGLGQISEIILEWERKQSDGKSSRHAIQHRPDHRKKNSILFNRSDSKR